ncbi:hypothetical protein BG261_05370 [Floricoccus tropicus]|uniref:Minor capsid protein n=1 Tax=Floricoccus tropicus TaxID=1859473 RepID=A0A1E8GKP5_9LACT|nr:putative minor capsid protein [Floricoccus tropicus]OFI48820.1 hypothetical protein BG261_05370 [Floricoccus tropicus]
MRIKLPPKQAFPHSITIKQLDDTDIWDKDSYKEEIILNTVRFDEGYNFRRQGVNSTEEMPNSLITMFKKYNSNMPTFSTKDIVNWRNREYAIVTVIPYYLDSSEIIGYELEVK